MQNLTRLHFANKIPQAERIKIRDTVQKFILEKVQPAAIYFFGSICTKKFDDHSDVDVIVVMADGADLNDCRKSLYGVKQPQVHHAIEYLCVHESVFAHKSEIGGVYYVAKSEGVRTYSRKSQCDDNL